MPMRVAALTAAPRYVHGAALMISGVTACSEGLRHASFLAAGERGARVRLYREIARSESHAPPSGNIAGNFTIIEKKNLTID